MKPPTCLIMKAGSSYSREEPQITIFVRRQQWSKEIYTMEIEEKRRRERCRDITTVKYPEQEITTASE